jgi:uncharacterized membrane protein YhaH (DUF805 family)
MSLFITKSEEDYNMFDWWKKAMINNYANFYGRARRKEYWYTFLVNILIFAFFIFVPYLLTAFFEAENNSSFEFIRTFFGILLFILFALFLIPNLAVSIRRLHDTGISGWFMLISLIPIIGRLILFIFLLTDSKDESNKWGKSPKYYKKNNLLEEIGKSEED